MVDFSGSRRNEKGPKSLITQGLFIFYALQWKLFWWSWGESNPRPKVFAGQIYTLS